MKKYLTFISIVCLMFSLAACSNELELIEGKFYNEENDEYYIELRKDGTFEMYTNLFCWWDENDEEHEICTGTYKVYKGVKDTNYVDYIAVFFCR